MIIKKRKTSLFLLLALIFTILIGFLILEPKKTETTNAQTIELEENTINDVYALNQKVVFPSSVDVQYENEIYTAENGIVCKPNGNLIDVNKVGVLFDLAGKYQIKYYFKSKSGKTITAEKEFSVVEELYSLSLNNGSSFVVGEESEAACENNADDTLYSKEEGLIVRLNSGASFVYNKPIDLTAKADGETAEIIKMDARLVDVQYNESTSRYERVGLIAEELRINLTDCYNSMNSIEIIVDAIGSTTYFRVKTLTSSKSYGIFVEIPTTLEANKNNKELYVDDKRAIAYFDNYGTYFSGYGYGDAISVLPGYTLSYDYDTHRVYYEYGEKKTLICDLLNTTLFDDDDFTPFTTGEVYLSMYANDYKRPASARVDILSVGGEKLTSNEKLYDTKAPKIDVAMDCTVDNTVYVAKGERFTIPSAKATDVNDSGELHVNVYRNYGTEMQSLVGSNVKSFVVERADAYTVEYSTTDRFGNVGVATVNVVAVDEQESLRIATQKIDVAYFGEANVLPEYQISSVNDTSKIKVEITAEIEGDKTQIDPENRIFKPKKMGVYTITFTYSDNVNTRTYSYTVETQARAEIVFLDQISFYDYVIKNAEYKIDPLYAYVKSENNYQSVKADCYVSYDGENFVKVENINKFKVEQEGTLYIKFGYKGVYSNVYQSAVVDVGYGFADSFKLSKYFLGDFSVLEYDSNGKRVNNIAFASNKKSGSNELQFINAVDYTQFKLEYRVLADKANYEKLNIRLIDATDKNKTFTITIRQSEGIAFISLNGGVEYLSSKTFAGEFVNSIAYNGDLNVLNINGAKYTVDFGFDSQFAYLEVEMENIYGEAAFTIVKINNSTFDNSIKSETFQPLVNIEEAYGQYEINSTVKIKTPTFSDVLTPINYDSVKFTVATPDGKTYATSVEGDVLDGSQTWAESYDVKLTQYGLYTVTYLAQDCLNNKISGQYRFEVKDLQAPTIVIKGGYDESKPMKVKLGKVNLSFDVSDNITAEKDLLVQINLMNDTTMVMQYDVGKSFTVSQKGTYTVFVYAKDADDNNRYVSFKLIVE
ncbi:MAG: hypothetical protein IJ506_06015 [Clostridia bacterium]|nr:hypothetical protein [Clostridia bacterium]